MTGLSATDFLRARRRHLDATNCRTRRYIRCRFQMHRCEGARRRLIIHQWSKCGRGCARLGSAQISGSRCCRLTSLTVINLLDLTLCCFYSRLWRLRGHEGWFIIRERWCRYCWELVCTLFLFLLGIDTQRAGTFQLRCTRWYLTGKSARSKYRSFPLSVDQCTRLLCIQWWEWTT